MRKVFTTAFLTIALGSSSWAQVPGGIRVALSPVQFHQLPIFGTAQAEIIDMLGCIARRVRQIEERRVQAFINEQFRHCTFTARGERVIRTGF